MTDPADSVVRAADLFETAVECAPGVAHRE